MHTIPQTALYDHPHFPALVGQVARCAHAKMPEEGERLDKATEILLAGGVIPSTLIEGGWQVASQHRPTPYEVYNGGCTCPDYEHHAGDGNEYACKHVMATWLYRRVMQKLDEAPPMTERTSPTIPAQCVVELHGKQFVTYAGLLALAHDRGLIELEADLTTVTDTLAIAKATAVFASGKRFTECADATPENVGAKIAPHFPRMALTRAKARALRDALNISMVALEELGE